MYAPPPLGHASSEETVGSEQSIRIADWVELNLMTEEEPSVSVADVTAMIAADPPDQSAASEHRLDYPESIDDPDSSELHAGYWQQAEETAELAFAELHQRSIWFAARYPIDVDGESATKTSPFDSTSVALFLTLLRSRQLFHRALEDDGELAGQLFEELLSHALRRYLGTSTDTVIRFGVAGGSRGDGLPIETDAAFDQLARALNEPRGDLANLPNGRDYGVDSVAWKPLGDPLRGKLTAIGQATISEGIWTNKQPSPKWKSGRFIRMLAQPTTIVSFVESISLTSNALLDGLPEKFSPIPMDRFRILFVVRDRDVPSALLDRMNDWSVKMLNRLPVDER